MRASRKRSSAVQRYNARPPSADGSRMIRIGRSLLRWEDPTTPGIRGALQRVLRRYLAWNRQLSLDPWLRYSAVVPILRRQFPSGRVQILDVGSGASGLASALRWPVVSVDVQFPQGLSRQSPMLRVKATADHLPFRERSFEAVVSMDVLEHIPHGRRIPLVREMFRVARYLVVIGFPFGPESAGFDEWALSEERNRGIRLEWREEHVRHGVPGVEVESGIRAIAREDPRGAAITQIRHESLRGLSLRWRLQFLVSRDSRAYGLVFAPLYWIHSRGRPRKAYRRIFIVRFDHP